MNIKNKAVGAVNALKPWLIAVADALAPEPAEDRFYSELLPLYEAAVLQLGGLVRKETNWTSKDQGWGGYNDLRRGIEDARTLCKAYATVLEDLNPKRFEDLLVSRGVSAGYKLHPH